MTNPPQPSNSSRTPRRERIGRLAGVFLSGTAVVLDIASLAADVTGHEGFSQCSRGGATALRAMELALRDRRPEQP